MQILSSRVNRLPAVVASAFVVESGARFGGDPVAQLLDPQSAVNHLLCQGNPSDTTSVDMCSALPVLNVLVIHSR